MSLWMLTPLSGRPVAVRIATFTDRARRLVLDDADPELVRDEWRCTRCADWVPDTGVTWIRSAKQLGNVPEVFAFCTPCSTHPERRLRR